MIQSLELSLGEAIDQAPIAAAQLAQAAAQAQRVPVVPQKPHIQRYWVPSAGTYSYHTHIAVSGQSRERFKWAIELFYNAAELERQPWYEQFLGGLSEPCEAASASTIEKHQFCLGRFDLGLGAPRAYRQLVSLSRPDGDTAVVVARSINKGPGLPENTKLAYTVDPNGEVLHWDGEHLHWHHICCTPGPALLPQPVDRYLMNLLRVLRLDGAERKTYRDEAAQFRTWLQGGDDLPR
ncbi:hypothetical protein FHR99_002473 [Litorivivens lipolytica]|uniref:Uncharacterized protein n=1 Tax=Litorivivens lipolytica TaxID=1524264 RepID=A0A7W4Z664_9GAMM|nr:hypothetical protein [Litorivivens lipolytica]MBB3048199.1 hypothetical protein [Litorivivens lipolytica]